MASDFAIIGNRIREIRKKRNLTQEKLAEKLGVTVSTISRFERGTLKININRLGQICKVLGVQEGKILCNTYYYSHEYLSNDIANALKGTSPNYHKATYEFIEMLKKYFPN